MDTWTAQFRKLFIEGIKRCVEHVQVVQELIAHPKPCKKTAHITWFDLEDAFGSVSHLLIPVVLQHCNLPPELINYIMDLYGKLKGRVVTKNWET